MSAPAEVLDRDELTRLVALLRGRRLAVLTGAGCSTESGIPDYRGPGTLRRARNPVPFRVYAEDAEARRRYWARAVVGWSRVREARPNPAHVALARMEAAGVLGGLITQNVDGLHGRAGSRALVELHGNLAQVRCLGCGALEARERLQARLLALNPGFARLHAQVAPDGDADLEGELVRRFEVAVCERCGGTLKPDVVFFGEGVPRPRVEQAREMVAAAEALLVVGSSLAVYSGLRFVHQARQIGRPVAIVNLGPTRGDAAASLCVDARAGELLPRLADALT